MKLEKGMKLHGFSVVRTRWVEELNATLVEMTHDKTGAALCWMDNGEDNKLFCIGFKTLPEDSTGVFHILEHSVLCGSDKYPVREPFVELLKSSMNTFLNAMTFSDKTIYPVSSRNEKDFLNLTSVYLDAVFAPALLTNPSILHQEGWHTEVNDGVPSYKGVVFNEMKGAMSDVDDIIDEKMGELLFPDNCYRFNSGGDPAVIPDLTYEQFVDTYQRFYHPSNSRIFLDGSVPLDDTLAMIDSYLAKYERSDETHDIPMQTPVSAEATCCYEIAEGEDGTNKVILNGGKIIGTWADKNRTMAAEVLCDLLADSNESPLKRAILSAGLAEDMKMMVLDHAAQHRLLWQVRNTSEDKIDTVLATIRGTVKELVEQGIDRGMLEASINRYAFRIRQEREPQGLLHAINSLNSWLYDGDPLLYLVHDESIAYLRELMDNGGYEKLLADLMLDDSGLCLLKAVPSTTYGAELRRKENERLQAEMNARTEADNAALEELNRKLQRWQQTPDSAEQLATLPVLPLSEVSEEPESVETEETEVDGVTVLHHRIPSKGITYLSLYFKLTDYTLEELTAIAMLPELLGKLPTARFSASDLQQEIKTHIGSLRFRTSASAPKGKTAVCTPYLSAHMSVLDDNWDKAVDLLCEIMLRTDFKDSGRIREIVMQSNEMGKQTGIMGGHMLGIAAVQSHYTAVAAVTEAQAGYTRIQWLHDMVKDFDAKISGLTDLLEQVCARSVCLSRVIASVTTAKDVDLSGLLNTLPVGEPAADTAAYTTMLPKRMGIRIPAQAAFAEVGYHLSQCGVESDGSLQVADNILSLSYLWNEIRVQGGAYGTGMKTTQPGAMVCYSYRDPSPARSLNVYAGSSGFLKAYCAGDEDLNKFIISAVANTEPLRAPGERGMAADDRWLSGITYEDRKQHRHQMLTATREKLLGWCDILDAMSADGAVCVVAHDDTLKQCENIEVFDL